VSLFISIVRLDYGLALKYFLILFVHGSTILSVMCRILDPHLVNFYRPLLCVCF